MPDEANPYAPPAKSAPPPALHGWSVQGEYLLVRNGTALPEVDLDGHGAGGPLTPVALVFPASRRVGGGIGLIAGLSMGGLVFLLREFHLSPVSIGLGVVVFAMLVRMLSSGRIATVSAKGHMSVAALRLDKRRRRRGAWAVWGCLIVALVAGSAIPDSPARGSVRVSPGGMELLARIVTPIAMILLIAAVMWQILVRRWSCERVQDGWLYLRGVGPAALAALAPRSGEAAPQSRRRKVYTVYLHRGPWASLMRAYPRNPWAWFYLGLLKLRRSKALEARVYCDSEREWRPAEAADAFLRADWERAVAGTPLAEWHPVLASRQDGPLGNVRSEEIVLLSPDRLHVARPFVVRAASLRTFLEFGDPLFRSWTQDGRIFTTGGGPVDAPSLPGTDYRRVKGSLWKIAHAHLARVAGEALVEIDPAEVPARMHAAAELGYQAGLAAGVYGPVEEIEVPESP
jgi:hypothetical protein